MNAMRTKLLPRLLVLLITLLAHHTARAWYDPGLQRWINRDPLGEAGFESLRRGATAARVHGGNLYTMARNGPTSRVDPLGLLTLTIYKCPNSIAVLTGKGTEYTCAVGLEGPNVWNMAAIACNAKGVLKCLAESVGVMNIGCALSDYETFSYGCKRATDCLNSAGTSRILP